MPRAIADHSSESSSSWLSSGCRFDTAEQIFQLAARIRQRHLGFGTPLLAIFARPGSGGCRSRFEQREAGDERPIFSAAKAGQCFGADSDFGFLEGAETGSGRNQVPQDHVFLQPDQSSVLPARAASVRTLVVSWKLAAEMKLELCTAALVIPSNWVLAVAGSGRRALGRFATERFDLGIDLSSASRGTIVPSVEVAVALVGDLQALCRGCRWPDGSRSGPSRCRAADSYRPGSRFSPSATCER